MSMAITFMEYVCRVCGTERDVGVMPREQDGKHVIEPDRNHKLVITDCECGADRTHVSKLSLSDGTRVMYEL